MKRLVSYQFIVVLLAATANSPAAEPSPSPDFEEVFALVRAQLPGLKAADLNRAAVDGLLANLRGKVSLVTDEAKSGAQTNVSLIAKTAVLDDQVGYVRVSRVDDGLAKAIQTAYDQFTATNKIKGLVLDLRFAGGDDYAAAAAVVDQFVSKELKLLDWGNGVVKSKDKKDAFNLPVAVLVNHETVGAPEALAAMFRETGTGLILGNTTAGAAAMGKEFTLKNGQRLRIASSPVKLGDGSEISAQGVKPDIDVLVSLADERAYLSDAYATLSKTVAAAEDAVASQVDSTNRPPRRVRPSEADLVRARREGLDFEELAKNREPEKPLLRDPALARAVDLLKGLAVVRRSRS